MLKSASEKLFNGCQRLKRWCGLLCTLTHKISYLGFFQAAVLLLSGVAGGAAGAGTAGAGAGAGAGGAGDAGAGAAFFLAVAGVGGPETRDPTDFTCTSKGKVC